MILECPDCKARFRVPPDSLGFAGRRVRCGACGHVWQAHPDEAGDESESPAGRQEEVPEDRTEPALEVSRGDSVPGGETTDWVEQERLEREVADTMQRLREQPAYAAANVPALPRRRPTWILLGWVAWGLFVAALIAGLLLYRSELQAAWPPSRTLYSMLGFSEASRPPPLPAPEDALQVQIGSTPQWQALQDGWRMTVDGVVRNMSERRMPLPPLTLDLMNAEGAVLKSVSVELGREGLDGRARLEFRKAIEPAPAETSGISYRWESHS